MRLAPSLVAAALALACASDRPAPQLKQRIKAAAGAVSRAGAHAVVAAPKTPPETSCAERIAAVQKAPGLPGTPSLDHQRAQIVARSKGEPVVFVQAPAWPKPTRPEIDGYRKTLEGSRFPWDTVDYYIKQLGHSPRIARQVFLRDGYLYAESADLSWSLWQKVELSHVFDEEKLIIERGSAELSAVKRGSEYVYADGIDRGKKARLLLFDRVRVAGQPRGPILHRDVRSAAHELLFDRMSVLHRTQDHLLTKVHYGDVPVTILFKSHGASLEAVCETFDDKHKDALQAARSKAHVRARVLAAIRRVILEQVKEQLPFDEPKREWGQQDGHLKRHWKSAYLKGEDSYVFNYDHYPVFSEKGQPAPPQVCIDFITETFERSSGTWWRPKHKKRERTRGGIVFDELTDTDRRQVPTFVAYAQKKPEWFEVYTVPTRRRLPYLFKKRFYRFVEQERGRLQPGDIVVIRGLAPWDHYNTPHYHTFFVYERDPITAMPILLAGNAGKPRIQSWEPVMGRTPHRKIETVVRPRLSWLAGAVRNQSVGTAAYEAPPLTTEN